MTPGLRFGLSSCLLIRWLYPYLNVLVFSIKYYYIFLTCLFIYRIKDQMDAVFSQPAEWDMEMKYTPDTVEVCYL